jgi:cation transport ATPase
MSTHTHHDHDRRQQFVTPPPARRGTVPWNMLLAIGGLVLVGTIAATVVGRGRGAGSVLATTGAAGADITLTVATFADGQARFYKYVTAAGQDIRFFVMKSADGVAAMTFSSVSVIGNALRLRRAQP